MIIVLPMRWLFALQCLRLIIMRVLRRLIACIETAHDSLTPVQCTPHWRHKPTGPSIAWKTSNEAFHCILSFINFIWITFASVVFRFESFHWVANKGLARSQSLRPTSDRQMPSKKLFSDQMPERVAIRLRKFPKRDDQKPRISIKLSVAIMVIISLAIVLTVGLIGAIWPDKPFGGKYQHNSNDLFIHVLLFSLTFFTTNVYQVINELSQQWLSMQLNDQENFESFMSPTNKCDALLLKVNHSFSLYPINASNRVIGNHSAYVDRNLNRSQNFWK